MKLSTAPQPAAGPNALPAKSLPGASDTVAAGLPPPSLPMHPAPQQQPSASVEAARQAAAQINEFLKSSAANVEFKVDSAQNRVIVRVVDSTTNQVIRQMPSEEAVAISNALDRLSGLLLQQKA